MARERYLKNAPIIEAMIDFRVRLPVGFAPEEFQSLKEDLSSKYPTTEKGRLFTGSIKIKDGKPEVESPVVDRGIQGYRFTSRDKKEVAQFRMNGFTFSRLYPYTKWEQVLDEAKRLWELYRSKTSPQAVDRIAVHYINRLDIPSSLKDSGDYMTVPPVLPKTLPQGLSQYLLRLQVNEEDLAAGIIQALVKSPKEAHLGIILDIDVFKVSEEGIKEENIWPTFDRLRKLKNRIFFRLITEKTARLFE